MGFEFSHFEAILEEIICIGSFCAGETLSAKSIG